MWVEFTIIEKKGKKVWVLICVDLNFTHISDTLHPGLATGSETSETWEREEMACNVGVQPWPMSKTTDINKQRWPPRPTSRPRENTALPRRHLRPVYLCDDGAYVSHVWCRVRVIHVGGTKPSLSAGYRVCRHLATLIPWPFWTLHNRLPVCSIAWEHPDATCLFVMFVCFICSSTSVEFSEDTAGLCFSDTVIVMLINVHHRGKECVGPESSVLLFLSPPVCATLFQMSQARPGANDA